MTRAADTRADIDLICSKRHDNGADFWSTPDGKWGKGSPFSTFDCALLLHELGVKRTDPILQGAAEVMLGSWREDGRIGPAPKGTIYPCHTANAARALSRLGHARDKRLNRTFEHLLDVQHDDGGWRCNRVKLGKGPLTDASNPGVTLSVLDAFRFTPLANTDKRLDGGVKSLLAHWKTRAPLGPCAFGIGSLFSQTEFPFLRYNLFFYVYVLSFYHSARKSVAFRQAFRELESKLDENDRMIIENPHRQLAGLSVSRKGAPSVQATKRWREIQNNING